MADKQPYVVSFTRTQEVLVGIYASSPEEAAAMVKADSWGDVVTLEERALSLGVPTARLVEKDENWPVDGYAVWPDA